MCCSVDEFFECLDTGSMLLATGTFFSDYTMALSSMLRCIRALAVNNRPEVFVVTRQNACCF